MYEKRTGFDYNERNTLLVICDKDVGCWLIGLMVFNATFNNISVISWRSVLLVEETGVPEENHRPAASS